MNFAEKLQYLRKLNNLTQEELGKQLGVTGSNVNRYEKGLSFPKLPTVVKIAKIFQISLDSLLDLETETNKQTRKIKQYQATLAPYALIRYNEEENVYNIFVKKYLYNDLYVIDKSGKLYDNEGFLIPDDYIDKEHFNCITADKLFVDEIMKAAKNNQRFLKAELEKVYNNAVTLQFMQILGQTAEKMTTDEQYALEVKKKALLDNF